MDITRDMSATEIRVKLATKGWHSNDRLSSIGWGEDEKGNEIYGYSIWFWRWSWHGNIACDKVCFHAHTNNLNNINETVYQAASKALKAWEECLYFDKNNLTI